MLTIRLHGAEIRFRFNIPNGSIFAKDINYVKFANYFTVADQIYYFWSAQGHEYPIRYRLSDN